MGNMPCPVIFGADLNSIPGSGVHHLVAHGAVPSSHPHLKIIAEHIEMPELPTGGGSGSSGGGGGGGGGDGGDGGGGGSVETCGGPGGEMRHAVDFGGKSVYATLLGQEPLFTNFTSTSSSGTFIGCLDYIFASTTLTPLQALCLPSEDELRTEGFLPNSQFPSDHLSLFAQFAFNRGGSANGVAAVASSSGVGMAGGVTGAPTIKRLGGVAGTMPTILAGGSDASSDGGGSSCVSSPLVQSSPHPGSAASLNAAATAAAAGLMPPPPPPAAISLPRGAVHSRPSSRDSSTERGSGDGDLAAAAAAAGGLEPSPTKRQKSGCCAGKPTRTTPLRD